MKLLSVIFPAGVFFIIRRPAFGNRCADSAGHGPSLATSPSCWRLRDSHSITVNSHRPTISPSGGCSSVLGDKRDGDQVTQKHLNSLGSWL